MSKLKNRITAYINDNLKHSDQFESISSRLNLQKKEKGENYIFMSKTRVLRFVLPCLVVIAIIVGIIIVGNGGGHTITNEPVAVVQMDVNPSISLVIDEDNVVVSIYGENDEGKMIINGEEFVGLEVDEAIEKLVNLESETGYLLRGSTNGEDNNIKFTIEANTEEIANTIQNNIESSIKDICDKLDIEEKLEIIKTSTKNSLVARAMSIDPTLTEDAANAMSNKELLAYISGCQIEKIEIPTAEIEELYDRIKTQKIQLVEKEETKVVIDKLDDSYQTFKNNYQSLYQGLINAQTALNDAYVKHFIDEESNYKKALNDYYDLKQEIILLENEISLMEEGYEKTIQTTVLESKKTMLETYFNGLQLIKKLSDTAIDALNSAIEKALEQLDEFYNQLPSEVKTQVNDSLSNIEEKINTAKSNMFVEFEEKYKKQIEDAYNESKAYKENLIAQLKNN